MTAPWAPLVEGGTRELYDAATAWMAAHEIVREDGRWPFVRTFRGASARRDDVLAGVAVGLVVDHRRDGLARWLSADETRAAVTFAWRRVRDPRAHVAPLPARLYLALHAYEVDGVRLLVVEVGC